MNQQLSTVENRKDIRTTLDGMKSQFAMALPRLLTVDRFIRVALTCINRNPKLLQCTRDSLLGCLLDCAQLGIEPDGRRAHLIPFNDRRSNTVKCTLIIDYKGLAELVRRSGEVSTLHAGIVYPSDDFDYAFGTGQYLKHRPTLNRGEEKPIAVYSYVKLKDGQEDFDVMGITEVEKVRARSRSANEGPWVTDFDEMAKKTAFRRHSKWLPLSPELREKIEKDDEPLTQQERFASAKPVNPASEGVVFGTIPETPEVVLQQFTPDMKVPTDALTPEEVGQAAKEGTTRRKRRTKAEMAAARGAVDGPEGPTGPDEPGFVPPRATPLEGLRNLINASPISEFQLEQHLIKKGLLLPHQNLASLVDRTLNEIIGAFMDIAKEILDVEPEEPKDQNASAILMIACACEVAEAAAAVPNGKGDWLLVCLAVGSLVFVLYYIITRWNTEIEGIS